MEQPIRLNVLQGQQSQEELQHQAQALMLSKGDYHKLSRFMGRWPEMSIFRRHGTLNSQNILFLQAELDHLEWELQVIREEDNLSADEQKRKYSQSWWEASQVTVDGKSSEQYQKIIEIRGKLTEYNAALLQYHDLCKLHRPTKHDLHALRYWLKSKDGGDCFLPPTEADPWSDNQIHMQNDLITMSDEHHHRDIFSAWLGDNVLTWYQQRFGCWGKRELRDIEGSMSYYGDSKIMGISRFFGALIASLLPAMSIFVLFFVSNLLTRLGAILGFSALFSFTLAIFTRATKREIFAATAAFASVQVVFVSQVGIHHTRFRDHMSSAQSLFGQLIKS